jgi:hypothetical protein
MSPRPLALPAERPSLEYRFGKLPLSGGLAASACGPARPLWLGARLRAYNRRRQSVPNTFPDVVVANDVENYLEISYVY